jgi:hypothetical protein
MPIRPCPVIAHVYLGLEYEGGVSRVSGAESGGGSNSTVVRRNTTGTPACGEIVLTDRPGGTPRGGFAGGPLLWNGRLSAERARIWDRVLFREASGSRDSLGGISPGNSRNCGGGGGTVSLSGPLVSAGESALASVIGGHIAHSDGHCRQHVGKNPPQGPLGVHTHFVGFRAGAWQPVAASRITDVKPATVFFVTRIAFPLPTTPQLNC